MPTTWHDGIVRKIETIAPMSAVSQLEVPEVQSFDFQAGQFVTMDLPIGENACNVGAVIPLPMHRTAPTPWNFVSFAPTKAWVQNSCLMKSRKAQR
jgi:NAD(P)H-flavin reductase